MTCGCFFIPNHRHFFSSATKFFRNNPTISYSSATGKILFPSKSRQKHSPENKNSLTIITPSVIFSYFCKKLHETLTLMTTVEYKQIGAFSSQDGALTGIIWIVSFACYIGMFLNQSMLIPCLALALLSPFFVAWRLKKFRDNIFDGKIDGRSAFNYSFFVFFGASVLMAAAQYIYFAFLDRGFYLGHIKALVGNENNRALLNAMKMTPEAIVKVYEGITPIQHAISGFSQNIFLGFILSIPIAILMKRKHN